MMTMTQEISAMRMLDVNDGGGCDETKYARGSTAVLASIVNECQDEKASC